MGTDILAVEIEAGLGSHTAYVVDVDTSAAEKTSAGPVRSAFAERRTAVKTVDSATWQRLTGHPQWEAWAEKPHLWTLSQQPGGELVLLFSSATRLVEALVDLDSGVRTELPTLGELSLQRPVRWSDDGRWLAMGTATSRDRMTVARGVVVWDPVTGQVIELPYETSLGIDDLAFSPDGRQLAVLRSRFRIKTGPLDDLLSAAGHPLSEEDFLVDVFDLETLASTRIDVVDDVSSAERGRLLWWRSEAAR